MGVTINNESTITEPSTLKDQNQLRIRYENNVKYFLDARRRWDVETILQRHDVVFKGKGNIHVKKNGENFLINFL